MSSLHQAMETCLGSRGFHTEYDSPLHFNSQSKRYVGLFSQKTEERVEIGSLDDIFALAPRILGAIQEYQG